MPNHFRYYLRVRYGECDAQKVVFNARYAEYIDLATTEFLRALGYGEQLFSGELDFQLVKQTIEWKAPARFDDFTRFNSAIGGQRPNSGASAPASSRDGGVGSRPGDYAIIRVPAR